MFEERALGCLLSCFIIIFMASATTTISLAKPSCQTKCGNVSVPFPFGIGVDGECSLNIFYSINCNSSYDPPRPFLGKGNLEIVDISITGQMRIKNFLAARFFGHRGEILETHYGHINLNALPLVFSDKNMFTVVGCDDYAFIFGTLGRKFQSGCSALCSSVENVINGSCTGIGCCQTSIPKGIKNFETEVKSYTNHTNMSTTNLYSYAFLAEQDRFNFTAQDLNDPTFFNKTKKNVPVVIDWFVGANKTCEQAQTDSSTYVCQQNTNCTDFDAATGYRCSCLPGYHGNPYLTPGCTDDDECADPDNLCSHICTNIRGSYNCSCPKGHRGDGLKNGSGCTSNPSQFVMRLTLGLVGGFLCLLTLTWICYTMYSRQKLIQKREKLFEQNGGILLKHQLSQSSGTMESSKIYSTDELKAATNNYREDRILGKGGYGTVYKGIVRNGYEVAIKKSKVADETQVEQFINEVVILTQINHRNVVKLLGCCLETEVPLLVYEFISNGTLFEHIHRNKGITSWLTWANCIRVASEVADALMYLHSAASIPIIHRDVKSTNILLDESYTAKISDFGASRLVPIDQTQVSTLVQGTLGYLDPEYFHTSQLTEKSDVYSFGIVLAELLTREKPLCIERTMEERNLATYFVLAMKEDRLMDILDPQLVREASEEQLITMGKLVKECLNVKGEDRPSMKEVALELEGLKKQNRHPWAEQTSEDAADLMGEHDLYPAPSIDHNSIATTMELSGQYSMEISLISDTNHPR